MKSANLKYFLKTFGCQMNVHDSEKIAGIFEESGFGQADSAKESDVVVLNTCSIREKAEHKFLSQLGRLKLIKKNNPNLKIAVAGCVAQQKGSSLLKNYPYVDFLFGPGNIDALEKWLNGKANKDEGPASRGERGTSDEGEHSRFTLHASRFTALQDNPDYHTKILPMKREGQVKAWVSIMYGCDNFCAYCVVPYTRGREKSRQSKDIYNEIRTLADQGYKEVTLLGQNVNSYGKNLNEKNPPSPPFDKGGQGGFLNQNIDFPDLLKVIHEIPGIERIRFITSHPKDFSEKLVKTIRDYPKLCEHVHLPVQSGSDKVLHLMNRRYSYKEYKERIDLLRKEIPGIAITTDIIVGFPGETEEDFACTLTALSEIEPDGIYSFKYSRRPDTKALDLPDHVKEEIISKRFSQLLKLQDSITYKKNKALEGQILKVLVEGLSDSDGDKLTGRTRTNKIVNFNGDIDLIGEILRIKIIDAKLHSLSGERD